MPEPTLTSKNLPPNQQPSAGVKPPLMPTNLPNEVEIPYDQIEAKPLRQPNFIALRPKNPNMAIYWGNRAVGEKESCMRYDQLIAMGFVPAEPKDVLTNLGDPCPNSLCRNNRIIYGDTILLKIPRADFVGALKWNEQNARLRVKRPGVAAETGASKDFGKDALRTDGRALPTAAGFPKNPKISTFVPSLVETDAKTADNSGPLNLAEK